MDDRNTTEYPYFLETLHEYADRYRLQMKLIYSKIHDVCDEHGLVGCSESSITKWRTITEDKAAAVATAIVRLTVPIDSEYSEHLLDIPTPDDETPSVWFADSNARYLEALRWMKHGVPAPAVFGDGPCHTIDALSSIFKELAVNPWVRVEAQLQDDLATGVFSILNHACLTSRDAAFNLGAAASGLRSLLAAGGGEPSEVAIGSEKRAETFREWKEKVKRTESSGVAAFQDFIVNRK